MKAKHVVVSACKPTPDVDKARPRGCTGPSVTSPALPSAETWPAGSYTPSVAAPRAGEAGFQATFYLFEAFPAPGLKALFNAHSR